MSDNTPRSTAERLAKLTTDVFGPLNLVIVGLPLIGLASDQPGSGFLWGCLASFFAGIIPLLIVIFGVKRRGITDVHVVRREQRAGILGAAIASVVVGLVLLYVFPASVQVRALTAALLIGLVAAAAITAVWKISIHMSVAVGFVLVFVLTFGPWGWFLLVPATAIGWSRLQLGVHTPAQVAAGAALGAIVTGGAYALLPGT